MSNQLADPLAVAEVSQRVLEILHRYRRGNSFADVGDNRTIDGGSRARRLSTLEAKIERFITCGQRVHFVIPAFPAKSPNRTKVLGELPDLGERISLGFLQSICDYVGHFYRPGAYLTICSDGHVFGDVVGVSDRSVTAYREQLTRLIEAESWPSLGMFGLDDAFGSRDYPKLRTVLDRDYAVPIEDLKSRVRTDDHARSLFNGIQRFMFEDAVSMRGKECSRTKLRNAAKASAYHTILRSNAWSRVVADRFPDAIRLSVHPQAPHSEKFGIHLMRTGDQWLTPWHGVVLDDGENVSLVRRWEAEKIDATAVWRDGRPSHFVAPHLGIKSMKGLST